MRRRADLLPGAGRARRGPAAALRRAGGRPAARAPPSAARPRHAAAVGHSARLQGTKGIVHFDGTHRLDADE